MSKVNRHHREGSGSPSPTIDGPQAKEVGFVKELFRTVSGPIPKITRIVVIGKNGVGKSALVVRFLTNRFIWEYDPTLECTYKHTLIIDDEPITLEILDTATSGISIPQDESKLVWGEGFMLVYSVTDRSSFREVPILYGQAIAIKKNAAPQFACLIVGNKKDMTHAREVSYEEGEQLAMELGCSFIECSAASSKGSSVHEAFLDLHRDLTRKRTSSTRRRRSSAQQVKQVFNKMFTKMNN